MKQKFLNLVLATMLLCFVSPAFANVAKIGDTEYPTLKQAITAAAAGQTITLIGDVNEGVVTFNKNLTLDGANNTFKGGIYLNKANGYFTIKNVNFDNDDNEDVIYAIKSTSSVTQLNVENCTCVDYTWGFIHANKAVANLNVKDVTVNGITYGVHSVYGTNITLDNYKAIDTDYALMVQNHGSRNVTLNNCTFEGCEKPIHVWERNQTNKISFTFTGDNVSDTEMPTGDMYDYTGKETNVTIAKYVAKIGDKGYNSLAEALAAIGAGDVVIELLEDATLNYGAREAYGTTETTSVTINGNGKTLTLNQTNSDWSSFGLAAGKVVFNNMTIEKTGHGDTGGAWNTHAIIFSSPVEMTDVTVNQSMAVQAGATLNNVTINEANGFYGLWINGNGQAVTVNGGAINATNGGRGIKIADQYIAEPAQVTLNVDGTVFSTAKKAAVLVSSKAGAKIAAANVNIENVVADPVNFVWIDEDWAAHSDKVEVTGAQVKQEGDFVAKLSDGTFHKTVADAITAAPAGATITLIADVNENVTISKNLTFDGAGKQYTGTMTGNAGLIVTVQNVNFVNGYFTKPKSTSGEYSFKNCTFDGNNGALSYSLDIKGAKTLNVENCSAKNYKYGFLYIPSSLTNASVKNVTVDGCPNYAIYFASGVTYGANIEGLTVKNANNGLVINNTATRKLTIKDCKMENVATAIDHSKGTFAINVTANGSIDFGGAAMSQYVNLAGGTAVVAKVGEVNYLSLADAVAAAQAGETIVLVNDATGAGVVINKNITIDFAGKTYTFNKTVGSTGTTTLGLQILKDNNVTLKNGTLTSIATVEGSKEVKVLVQNYANLTLQDMNLVDKTEHIQYALSTNCGTSKIEGATNITTDAVAIDLYDYSSADYALPSLSIATTGKIEGKVEVSETINDNMAISAGTFTQDVTEWCASGYVSVNNGDGTYGVKVDPAIGKVAKVGEEYYETVAAAITAAPAGATITLIADVNENVTISKDLTIDGAGKQYTGTMTVKSDLTVTVQNVNFVNAGFDKPKAQNSTKGIYNIKNCTFDGAGSYAYPIRMYGCDQINVENCTVKDYLYSFLYVVKSALNVSVKNVTVENCPNYAIYFASGVNNANIEGLTVKNANNGLIINNAAARKLTIKDCKMENVATAINHSGDNTNAINVTANGVNDFGTAVMSQYVKIKAAAQVGTKVCGTLAEAVEAAQAGEIVKLLSNVELSTFLTINKSITLDLGEYNITRADGTGLYVNGDVEVAINGTGKVSGAQALYVANGLVKVNGGNFVGNKEAVYVQNTGKVEIYGGTFEATNDDKTFVLNKYDSDRATTSITVYGGTFVGFDPANNAAEGKNTNFVAEGYASVDNGDGTYTVAAIPVAEVDGKTYGSLIDAFAAAQDGETVKLIDNVALDTKTLTTQNDGYSVILNVKDKAITLDLNGKNITVDAAAADLANANGKMLLAVFSADLNGHLTLTDNTEAKNGTVTVNVKDANVYSVFVSESAPSDKSNNGKITVEAGNYTTVGKVSNAMFFTDADEVITVNGGNFYCDGATTTTVYPWMFNTLGNDVIQVIVSGGTFNVNVSKQYRSAEVQLVEGKIIKDNGDGTWTVVPGYDEFTIVHDEWKSDTFKIEKDMPVNTLNYVRNFSNTNWRAFYVPFAINYDDIKDNFDVARVNMAHQEEIDGKVQIKIDFISMKAGQKLKANYPYFIRPKKAGEYTITVKNTTLKETKSRSIDCSTVDMKFTFTGTYRTIFGDELVDYQYYYMSGGKLGFTLDRTYQLNPFNWYMTIEGREDLSDVKFIIGGDFEDEETTGITNINNDQINNDGNIYDLQGRRVLHPQKGSLYIVNGKKVVY